MTPLETLDRIHELVNMPLPVYLEQRQRVENGLGIYLPRLDFRSGNFTGADFKNATLHDADMAGANFTLAAFERANLADVEGTSAIFYGADFRGADLTDSWLQEADLRGADFTTARTKDAYFLDAKRSVSDGPILGWRVVGGTLVRSQR